jgi:hypothetical protein
MKVNTTIKKVLQIELTMDDVRGSLKNHQQDMLHDLASALKANDAFQQYEIFWNLLQGERSEWFQNMIEKHGIYWIETPTFCDGFIELIEGFPHIFIHDAVNLFADVDESTLTVYLINNNGSKIKCDSKKIIDNL